MSDEELRDLQEEKAGAKFIKKMKEEIGELDGNDEALLNGLSIYVDHSRWDDFHYTQAARLFMDYRAALKLMGKDAKAIGYQISICSRIFQMPDVSIQGGALMTLLKDIRDLHSGGQGMLLPYPRFW